jgi:hypothetical protein
MKIYHHFHLHRLKSQLIIEIYHHHHHPLILPCLKISHPGVKMDIPRLV